MLMLRFTIITAILLSVNIFGQGIDSSSTDQKLSLDVKDTDIRDVIRMISKGYNLNILLDQNISGKITLHLANVPIMEGLRSIAESNGLEVIQDGSVYKIQKATEEQKSNIRYSDGKLTIDVQNVNVRDFLKELSSKTAVSIVPDAKVDGKISGKLYQVSFDDGLRALLEGNGFKVVKRKNIYQVLSGDQSPVSSMQYSGSPGGKRDFSVDYSNGNVSLDVTNGDLEDIIKAIAEQSDIEIITYGSIRSEINAKLNNLPLTEALALLLGGTRFTFVQKDNVILIGDRNTGTPSGDALSKSELIHLNHIKADNIPSILPKDIPANNVRVIKEQNALLISGTSEDIVSAKEFLKAIDIPTPQVRIDAVIVEFKDNLDKNLGFRFGNDSRLINSSYNITPAPETRFYPERQEFEYGMSGKFIKDLFRKSPNSDIGILGHLPDDFFGVIRALESQDKAKVLAQPSILTLNGNKASIDVSETQYYKISTGVAENYTTRFQPIKFGIQLDIVPWISQSGQITAEITPDVSNSDKVNNEGYPNVSTRSITTTVRLNDGETLVLGGLIKNQESEFNYKVPILGSIPIIGALFRHSGKTKSKSNLVVYITPHIISGNEHVDLKGELQNYDMHDKNVIEKEVHKGIGRLKSIYYGTGETQASEKKKDKSPTPKNPSDTLQKSPASESVDSLQVRKDSTVVSDTMTVKK